MTCAVRHVPVSLADHWEIGNSEKLVTVDVARAVYGAIAIGAESEFDRCWVFPKGQLPARVQSPAVNLSIEQLFAGAGGFLVSAERPWVGQVEGPFTVLLPYATSIFRGASSGFERVTPVSENMSGAIAGGGMVGFPGNGRLPSLVLDFHAETPRWLPSERSPREYVYLAADFGTSSTKRFRVPTYGRRYTSIALKMTGYGSGTLRAAITGYRALGFPINGQLEITEEMLAATDFTADFSRIYESTAEYDFIEVLLTEQAAMSADALVGVVVTTRDR